MYDEQTNSDWSHILGKSMAGPLKDKQLVQMPSVMTDWATWVREHPDSTVLWMSATSETYRREFYRNRPERFVLGITSGGKSMAWGLDVLSRSPVMQSQFDDRPVVAFFDRDSVTARLYARDVDGQTLSFSLKQNGQLTDEETGSIWDPITGQATSGKLVDKSLQALPAILSYRKTWKEFHPKSRYADIP